MRVSCFGLSAGPAAFRVRTRAAMTLLELILVMALLVVMGALALPSLQTPFENQRVRKAGDAIRVAWNKARIEAMKTGQTQMFCCDPEERAYYTRPHYSDQDVLEADAEHGGISASSIAAADRQQQAAAREADTIEAGPKKLPEGVVFVSSQVRADVRSLRIQDEMDQQQYGLTKIGGAEANAAESVTPILFYPDGTTSDARLVLANQSGKRYLVICLRSLTGTVKISGLVSADEVELVP